MAWDYHSGHVELELEEDEDLERKMEYHEDEEEINRYNVLFDFGQLFDQNQQLTKSHP